MTREEAYSLIAYNQADIKVVVDTIYNDFEKKINWLKDEINNLINIIDGNLYKCKKCNHYVKSSYICLFCGTDNNA